MGDLGSRELQFNRFVEEGTASVEAYEILESRLIFERIKYISETYGENFKTFNFTRIPGNSLVILRELYQARLTKSKW